MQTIRLMTCESSVEANIIKGRLESEGIECFIANENFSNLMPHYNNIMGSGAQIIIKEDDLDKAKQLLEIGTQNKLVCPECRSTSIRISLGHNRIKKMVVIFLSLLSVTPFNNISTSYVCNDCKTAFKQ